MRYISTRGSAGSKTFSEILLEGLSSDGGLFVPEEYPEISAADIESFRNASYADVAFGVLSRFVDDIPSADLRTIIDATYTQGTFGTSEIVPLKKLEDGLYLLGLSEGPTLAFKDVALQLLGRLFEYVLAKKGEHLNILGATSGDTGSAAEYAMRGRKGINVFMLSPLSRMSEFQRKQMFTLQDVNIFNIAVRGTFDDCQDLVKELNEDADFKKKYKLGAVNSINWARIAAQIVYYFVAYARLSTEDRVDFAVPTGNFGNILAGYIAKRMGLSIGRLILATNENNVLEDFVKTGVYRPRKGSEVAATSSPSMDISKASNFERYVFDLVDRDPARIRLLLNDLKTKGQFNISGTKEFEKLSADGFVAGSSAHADRLATIKDIYECYKTIIDTHTADAMTTGRRYRGSAPLVVLETAQAAKFSDTIREAIGREPDIPPSFQALASLPERFETMDADSEQLKKYIATNVS